MNNQFDETENGGPLNDAADVPRIPNVFGQAPPPVTVKASPLENGAAVYAPMAPETAGTDDKPKTQLNLDLYLTNTGESNVTLSGFQMAYVPPPVVLVALTTVAQLIDNNLLLGSPTIAPGDVRKLIVPASQLPYPAPRAIFISLSFEGFPGALETTFPLVPHVNCVPGGAYRFPFRASDLADGEYWSGGIPRLVDGAPSHHRAFSPQRFAYDLIIRKWDPDEDRLRRTFPGSTGNENEDYLAWGKPVYAMAAGTIISCGRDIADNPNPPAKISGGGGNTIWIQHANGEVSMYAHLMQHSIPEHLCEVGYKVCENEFLGLVGNSGSSSEPHLHVQVQRGRPNSDKASGRPLPFRGIHSLPKDLYAPGGTDTRWTYVDGHGLNGFSLIWPVPSPPLVN